MSTTPQPLPSIIRPGLNYSEKSFVKMTDNNTDSTDIKQSLKLAGTCYCKSLTYQLNLDDKKDARTTLCHCENCKKAFGGAFGLAAKVPIQAF